MNPIGKFLLSLAPPFLVGAIGSWATYPNIAGWYALLEKPFFSPPNWLFGPVWTLLYLFMAISFYMVWTAKFKGSKKPAFIAYAVQLSLNLLWSLVFFGLQAPWFGVAVIVAMLVAIAVNIKLFWPISQKAAYLLVPYLLWVSFATALNVAVALLN